MGSVRQRPDRHVPRGAGRAAPTPERAVGFLAAGADGIFVPGAVDPGTGKLLADAIDGRLHGVAGPDLQAARQPRPGHRAGRARPGGRARPVRRAARVPLDAWAYHAPTGGPNPASSTGDRRQ
ncbi:hypothetical protein ACFZB4_03935 [Streptomyces pseudovenezuelae]|uniref:hypothetical protein n=1 Tax=Streptomyces pseudovenezuelae TaxID=67350 RepID=UPI0036E2C9CB